MTKIKTPNSYYENRLKPPKSFFEWCYMNMRTYVWENKNKKIISSNRKHIEVIKKRLSKNSRLSFFDRYEYFEIILSTSKRIERQIYQVNSFFTEGKQQFEVNLINLHIFINNKHLKIRHVNKNLNEWGLKPLNRGICFYYTPFIFPNNWIERLKRVSELKYLDLSKLDIDYLDRYYKYKDRLEFVQKIEARGLERMFHSYSIDFRSFTLKLLHREKVFFRKSDNTITDLKLKLEIEKRGSKYILGIGNLLSIEDLNFVDTKSSLIRLQNYLIKQKTTCKYYLDYCNMLQELKIEKSGIREFPKDLRKAHNQATDLLNSKKREITRKEIYQRSKKLKKMEMTINEFTFILPKNADEIISEGKTLNHCVGQSTYINNHAEGKTTLVFVRQKTKKNIPYFTMEYKDNEIKQLEGYKNEIEVPEKLKIAVELWKKRIKKIACN